MLKKAPRLVVMPDSDAAGEKWLADVLDAVTPVVKSLNVVRLPGLPQGGDVTDWRTAGGTKSNLSNFWTPQNLCTRETYPGC